MSFWPKCNSAVYSCPLEPSLLPQPRYHSPQIGSARVSLIPCVNQDLSSSCYGTRLWLLLVLLCTSESSFNLFPSLLSKSRLLAIAEAFFLLTVILSPVNFVLLHNLQRRSSDQLSTWHTGSPQRTWYNIEHTRGGRGYQHFLISCITYIWKGRRLRTCAQ